MAEEKGNVPAWQRHVLRTGKLTLTVLIAVQLAALCWRIVAPEPLVLPAPAQSSGQTAANSGVQGTAQYHLFGEVGVEPIAQVTEQVSAPETRLRLQLLGITKGVRNETSSAIIAPQGGSGEFYRIGDVVQGSTRLAAVYDDRVILDTNGKLETLKFEELSAAGITARAITAATTPVRPAPPRPEPARVAVSAPAADSGERFSNLQSPADFINRVTSEAAVDAAGTLRELGLESIGSGQGYRVTPDSMLIALQLQPGDVVLSVNGRTLGDPQADQQLLEQVSAEGNARIEVQRGNNRFVVNHNLNQ